MEVKIGVQHASRELTLDCDLAPADVEAALSQALEDGGLLSLNDVKGRRVLVPAQKIAYLEVSTSAAGTVGFRS